MYVVQLGGVFTAYQSMEKMLEELSNRWSVICQWITNKWELLQDVDVKWRLYHSKADLFNQWLSAQEVVLQQMKSSDISDPAVLLNQVQRLKVNMEKIISFEASV